MQTTTWFYWEVYKTNISLYLGTINNKVLLTTWTFQAAADTHCIWRRAEWGGQSISICSKIFTTKLLEASFHCATQVPKTDNLPNYEKSTLPLLFHRNQFHPNLRTKTFQLQPIPCKTPQGDLWCQDVPFMLWQIEAITFTEREWKQNICLNTVILNWLASEHAVHLVQMGPPHIYSI